MAITEGTMGIRRGATWLTLAALSGGALNFVYALGLTWMLPSADYPSYAGTQALLLVCGSGAAASAPWLLAQRLARNASPESRKDAIAFALALTLGPGLVAATIVAAITSRFSEEPALLPLVAAVAAFAIFCAATSTGYVQGRQRFGWLAALVAGEVVVKVAAGILLLLTGAGVLGVIAGIAMGGLTVAAVAGAPMLRELRAGIQWLRDRDLWRLLVGLGAMQVGLVLLINLDLILGSLLGEDNPALSGYQASVFLSRIPLYLGASLSAVVFTKISSRQVAAAQVIGPTLAILLAVAIAAGVAVATLPLPVIRIFLPGGYPDEVAAFVRFTAPAGVLAALSNLASAFYQAEGRFRAGVAILGVGLATESVAVVTGLAAFGVMGLAWASLLGQALTAALLWGGAVRFWGRAVLPPAGPVLVVVAAVPLFALRLWPPAWLAYAVALGLSVGWIALFRREGEGRPEVGAARPRVYMVTTGPVSPPWDGGDTNLARALVSADIPYDFTFLGQRGDTSPVRPGHARRDLAFATTVPTLREQLRILARLGLERERVDLVHMVVTFGPSRLKELVLRLLPLVRAHPLLITCPNGAHLPAGLLARAEGVVAISRHTEARLRRMGIERVHVVPPGIDLEFFRPRPGLAAREAMGIPGAPALLFAGHYDPGGGLEQAVELTARLRAEFPELRLLTAMRTRPGAEQRRERVRLAELVRRLGLEEAVIELGGRADIPLALQAASVVLFQPQDLGRKMDLPMVLLEALASGRPVAVSPIEGLGELADGTPAVVVGHAAEPQVVDHLRRLLSDPAFAAEASADARRLAERRYSATEMTAAYASLYQQVIAKRTRVSVVAAGEIA